jgi:hypothetical protein
MNANVDGNGLTPPDTTGAISAGNYVEFVNSQVSVYNRSLVLQSTQKEDTFANSSGTCDGQIKFDQAAGRFLYWNLDCAAGTGGEGFSFGWSKTSSPLPLPTSSTSAGNWCRFHVNTGSELEDYGKLGESNGFMIVGANEFDDFAGYDGSPIFAIAKPANGSTTCPAGSSIRITKFVPPASDEFSPEPANISGSSASGDVVAISGSLTTALRMYTLSGGSSTTSPTLTDNGNITVPAFSVPANIPQPGSTDKLDSSDARLTQANAAFDPGVKAITVWTQHTIAGANGGPSVVRWYELTPGQATPVQSGIINPSGLFAFNGAIAPTRAGNAAAIDYNVGSGTQKVLVKEQDRAAGAAPGTLGAASLLATSTGIDSDFSCPSQGSGSTSCRWGDYAGASTDPAGCGAGVWGSNQFNGTQSGSLAEWQTQNFSLLADECPKAAFTFAQATSPAHTETFNASTSSDADGAIATYKWSFGDGVTQTTTTATTSHTYATAGNHNVMVTITDSSGLAVSVAHSVSVT